MPTVCNFMLIRTVYCVTRSGKTGFICATTKTRLLVLLESYSLALSRSTKYLTIDGRLCFHKQLFKPGTCQPQASIRLVS